jgi:hypothetical protein
MFRATTPKGFTPTVHFAGRVYGHDLHYDAGSLVSRNVRYTDDSHNRALVDCTFRVNGYKFSRVVRQEAIGNYGVAWATIGGKEYKLLQAEVPKTR